MKYFIFGTLIILAACSTSKESRNVNAPKDVSKDSFKKEKVLLNTEVKDYISEHPKTLNPALQDETLDRYTTDELDTLSTSSDPLIAISLRCSKKDFDTAYGVAAKNFNRYQKIPAYWNAVANCHLLQGNSRKALLFYNKALEVSPNYVPSLNNIGVLYSRQGEEQKALVAFERANQQSRFAKTPRYNLARLYLRYGLVESAMPLFQGLLNESPTDVDLINAVGNCYFFMSDYQKAYSLFAQIPASALHRAEYGLNFAVTLKKIGKTKEAMGIFDDIQKPQSSELKEYYTVIAQQLGIK